MNRMTIVCIALSTVLLVSCGTPLSHIHGSWDLDVEDSTWTEEGGQPSSVDMNLNPDGTIDIKAVLPGLTESLDGTYGFDGQKLTVTHDTNGERETQTVECHLKGDTLTFVNRHGKFVFRKEVSKPESTEALAEE